MNDGVNGNTTGFGPVIIGSNPIHSSNCVKNIWK